MLTQSNNKRRMKVLERRITQENKHLDWDRKHLENLASRSGSDFSDVTDDHINRRLQIISTYEKLLARRREMHDSLPDQ